MSLWAIMLVKDEADVIEPVLRHIDAQGVDGILILENASTDGTAGIIDKLAPTLECDLAVQPDPEIGYWQSSKMTAAANYAHEKLGAEWIWPCDADELWYYVSETPLVEVIERQGYGADVIHARLWHHFPTAVDLTDGNPFERMQYRGDEAPIGKVIVRWQPGAIIEAGNHAATIPGGGETARVDIQIRHFPYRSAEQFVRKAINGAAAYAATDLPWGTGQHWREYGVHYERGGEEALREIYWRHFYYDLPSAAGLVYDPARLDA